MFFLLKNPLTTDKQRIFIAMCDPRSSCHDSDLLLPHSRVKCHGAVQASLVARMFSFDVKDQWKENQWKDFLKRSRL
jgi:hypothetical protein